MILKMEEIQAMCQILVDQACTSGFQEVKIKTDYYWMIDSNDREDFTTGEPTICVGSLRDDIESMKKVLAGITPATPVDFDRLGNVLISIGEEISRSKKVYL